MLLAYGSQLFHVRYSLSTLYFLCYYYQTTLPTFSYGLKKFLCFLLPSVPKKNLRP